MKTVIRVKLTYITYSTLETVLAADSPARAHSAGHPQPVGTWQFGWQGQSFSIGVPLAGPLVPGQQ